MISQTISVGGEKMNNEQFEIWLKEVSMQEYGLANVEILRQVCEQ